MNHPVGSTFESEVLTPGPAEMFGGTWERIEGVFSLAASSEYLVGAENTGGERYKRLAAAIGSAGNDVLSIAFASAASWVGKPHYTVIGSKNAEYSLFNHGTIVFDEKHSNSKDIEFMPPYRAFYKWLRIA